MDPSDWVSADFFLPLVPALQPLAPRTARAKSSVRSAATPPRAPRPIVPLLPRPAAQRPGGRPDRARTHPRRAARRGRGSCAAQTGVGAGRARSAPMPAPRRYQVRAGGRASSADSRRVRPPRLSGPARPASAFGEAARPPPAPPPARRPRPLPLPPDRAGAGRAVPSRWVWGRGSTRWSRPLGVCLRRFSRRARPAQDPCAFTLPTPLTPGAGGLCLLTKHTTPSSPSIHRAGDLDHTWRPRKPLCQFEELAKIRALPTPQALLRAFR